MANGLYEKYFGQSSELEIKRDEFKKNYDEVNK